MHLPTIKMVYTAIGATIVAVVALFLWGLHRHGAEALGKTEEPTAEVLVISPQPLKPATVKVPALEPIEETGAEVRVSSVELPQAFEPISLETHELQIPEAPRATQPLRTVTRKRRVSLRVLELKEVHGKMVGGHNLRKRQQ